MKLRNFLSTMALMGILCYFLLWPARAFAATSFKLTPAVTHVRIGSEQVVTVPITMENLSSDILDLSLSLQPFTTDKESQEIVFLEKNDTRYEQYRGLFLHMEVPEEAIILGPHEKKTISITINQHNTIERNDYTFSIILRTRSQNSELEKSSDQAEVRSQIQTGIASNIFVSFIKPETQHISLKSIRTPSFTVTLPITTSVSVENAGKTFAVANGILRVKDIFGAEIENFVVPKATVLPDSSRALSLLDNNKGHKSISNNVMLLSNAKIPLGIYSIELTLSVNDEATFEQSRLLIVANLQVISAFIGILIFLLWLIARVRMRLRTLNR